MREHYNLDRLVDYSVEDIPGTTRVVNPQDSGMFIKNNLS
jgi:hypothetical protein